MKHFIVPSFNWSTRRKDGTFRESQFLIGAFQSLRPRQYRTDNGKRYIYWRQLIIRCANRVGIKTPIAWDSRNPGLMIVVPYYYNPRRKNPDPENVQKSIRDALAYVSPDEGSRGDDYWCAGMHTLPQYDETNPRVEVWLYRVQEYREYVEMCRIQVFSRQNGL